MRRQIAGHVGVPAAALGAEAVAARLVAWWTTLTRAEPGGGPSIPPLTFLTRESDAVSHQQSVQPPAALDEYEYLYDGTDPKWAILPTRGRI